MGTKSEAKSGRLILCEVQTQNHFKEQLLLPLWL